MPLFQEIRKIDDSHTEFRATLSRQRGGPLGIALRHPGCSGQPASVVLNAGAWEAVAMGEPENQAELSSPSASVARIRSAIAWLQPLRFRALTP
jgi:hypothetical protein